MDLLERSIPGVIAYTILWPAIFISVGLHHTLPLFCWGFAIALATISLLRYIHKFATDYLYRKSQKLWLALFALFSISQASLMGILLAFSLIDEQMQSIKILMVLAASGMSSGVINSLNAKHWLAITCISMILLPSIISNLVISHDYPMALLITIYLLTLNLLGRRSHKEYFRAFEIEQQLNEKSHELEQLNKIDPLTLIYNRGYFNNSFEFQWNVGIRHKQKLSLLLIDADKFKSINDNYGHLLGDECLKTVAKTIKNTVKRKTDIVARYGGEEFVVLLSDTSCQEACDIAERIREQIEATKISYDNQVISVTISIGVSCMLPQPSNKPDDLISMADKALYQAKEEGRNRICSANCVETKQ